MCKCSVGDFGIHALTAHDTSAESADCHQQLHAAKHHSISRTTSHSPRPHPPLLDDTSPLVLTLCPVPPRPPACPLPSPRRDNPHTRKDSNPAPHGHAKVPQPKEREHAQPDGQRLLAAEGARHAAAGQHHAGEQGELDAVGLAGADAVAAEGVLDAALVLVFEEGEEREEGKGKEGREGGAKKGGRRRTSAPTPTPAVTLGMEPVRT